MLFLVLQSSCWGIESWLLYFNCLLMSFDCWYSLSPPHGAVVGLCVIMAFPGHTVRFGILYDQNQGSD